MNKGQIYASRKSFIEDGLGGVLQAKQDFAGIKYARNAVTEQEYMRIGDVFGRVVCINITGDSLDKILQEVSRVVLMGTEKVSAPAGVVNDIATLREIAPLFK